MDNQPDFKEQMRGYLYGRFCTLEVEKLSLQHKLDNIDVEMGLIVELYREAGGNPPKPTKGNVIDKAEGLLISESLMSLIDGWNAAGEREDRGRPNNLLCLVMADDGSGKLGTFQPICGGRHDEILTLKSEDVMNVQLSFDSVDELAAYLAEQCFPEWRQ